MSPIPAPPIPFAIFENISVNSSPPDDSFILPKRSPASFIISSREISPFFNFASNLPPTVFINPIIFAGFFMRLLIKSCGFAFSCPSPNISSNSPEISSAISFANDPILPLKRAFKWSCIFSISGMPSILDDFGVSSDELLSSGVSLLGVSVSIFLKKSVNPDIVSFIFSWSSSSSIPSNKFIESPNDDLSFIPPTTVNRTS